MALFNRKKRSDEDGDNVRLTSADHSWWTGEEPPVEVEVEDEAGDDHVEPGGDAFGAEAFGHDESCAAADAVDDGTTTRADEVISGIAHALSEYAYADATPSELEPVVEPYGDALDDDIPPGVHFAAELDGGWHRAETDDDLQREVLEQALFVRDGLPLEDHLGELLGALGLEGDADWVDIARAHRRLVSASTSGRAEWEQERQRRTANEAYACLRLFHH